MGIGVYATINKEKIDEVYKSGIVKPNEYECIRDNLIEREMYLRYEQASKRIDKFFSIIQGKQICDMFYHEETKIQNVKDAIINLAYNSPEKLLIEKDDIGILILADVAFNRASRVRDLGDLNRSKLVEGDILADKETVRSLEYLTKYKRGLRDLLECLAEEEELV